MKKLIYLPLVLIIALLAASCQKDDSVTKPGSKTLSQDLSATISVVNNSDTPYEVLFQGLNYTLDVPKNGRVSATIKAGIYDIEIYPASSADYASHSITWDNLKPVLSPRANFNNVQIGAASLQSLVIY